MSLMVTERRLATAEEFVEALMPWSKHIETRSCVFRGHANSNYKLVPTSLRENSPIWNFSPNGNPFLEQTPESEDVLVGAEFHLLREFYKGADARGLSVPVSSRIRSRLHEAIDSTTNLEGGNWLPDDLLETAGLAQHYGIPTRLLDWSYDPLVAAYFSSRPQSLSDNDICVWAMKPSALLEFSGVLDRTLPALLKIVTPPYAGNPNLAAQRGLFTYWHTEMANYNSALSEMFRGNVRPIDRRSLEILIQEYYGTVSQAFVGMFTKLVLPNEQAWRLAKILRDMGYGPARLFPGYEGVVMELEDRKVLFHEK